MSRDINPYGLRMPQELKDRLEREAKINGRSLNAELVLRLEKSLERQGAVSSNGYTADQPTKTNDYTVEFTDLERQLLSVFRRMPVEKQLALISLFK